MRELISMMKVPRLLFALVLLLAVALGCRAEETLQPVTAGRASLNMQVPVKTSNPAVDNKNKVSSEPVRAQPKTAAPIQNAEVLYIQPLGVEQSAGFQEDMEFVKKAIAAFYALEVRLLQKRELPKEAWYAPRKRYRAERLLDYLEQVKPKGGRILGITTKDISTTKDNYEDWGILGLATLDGTVCVVSTFRAARKIKVGLSDALTVRYRFAKTVVHELGHNFGLDHCPNKGCIMEDAKGTVSTTDGEFTLCPSCLAAVKRLFPAVAVENIQPPWPEPNSK
jgi:archaemetzincin